MSGPHTEDPEFCTRRGAGASCLHDLAAGWITASDLCRVCTRRFMSSMDDAAGEALPWHEDYLNRAGEDDDDD